MGQRQSFAGAAPPTTIASDVGPDDTMITVASTTGWPDYTVGPFVATLDRLSDDTAEKILVQSYTATVLTVAERGYDGTTATSHSAGSGTAEHTIDAAWHQDVSNQLYEVTAGDLLYAPADGELAHLGIGSTGELLVVTAGLPSWGTPEDSGWVTPGSLLNGWVAGSPAFQYRKIANRVMMQGVLANGGSGTVCVQLPSGFHAATPHAWPVYNPMNATGVAEVDTSGNMSLTGNTPDTFDLAPVTYTID